MEFSVPYAMSFVRVVASCALEAADGLLVGHMTHPPVIADTPCCLSKQRPLSCLLRVVRPPQQCAESLFDHRVHYLAYSEYRRPLSVRSKTGASYSIGLPSGITAFTICGVC